VEEDNAMKEQAFLSLECPDRTDTTSFKANGMGRTCSSRSHSRNTSFRKPHSMLKTSDRIDAELNVSWTPEKSTVLGLDGEAC